jgi:hypothetical protein
MCSCSKQETTNFPYFEVGAASKNITPQLGMFIAGDAQNRRFTGVHDSLYVRAVVLKSGTESLALVTVNCIGLLYPEIQQIRSLAAEQTTGTSLATDRIIVTSDHIHSGPDVVGIWGASQGESGRDSTYISFLVTQAAAAVEEAAEHLQPAKAYYARGEFGAEWVENISIPEEIDRSLTVMQFTNEEHENIATFTNFACHPTFYDAVQHQVSADYVGAFIADLSHSMPGEHLFLQGAIGGWVQPRKEDQSYAIGEKHGIELSDAVQELLLEPNVLDSMSIEVRNAVFEMPVSNPGWKQLAELGVIDREINATTTSEMVWFRIGPAQFITHPGETPPAYSIQSKAMMKTEPKFVLGLGMDAMGYILKPEFFGENPPPHAAYLTRMSPGPEAGPLVMELAETLIQE